MAEYRKVVVLKGGPAEERDVSLRSGAAVARGLREAGYEVLEVDVTEEALELPNEVDAVFVALHGRFGEDGRVQRMLRERGLPYTGSGEESSRIAFDKCAAKDAFEKADIPTPQAEALKAGDQRTLDLPVVVKPPSQGSSIGIHCVFAEQEWEPAFNDALSFESPVLVEQFVDGRELTVGVVDGEVLPIVEIVAPDGNYDFEAKYTSGKTKYLVPAPLEASETKRCQALGLKSYRALGCEGMARVDIRLRPDGEPFVLEVNTIPGFTETSLLPKAAAAAGIPFSALCGRILQAASVH